MALADRYYMRDQYNSPRMTTRLIWLLIGCFVIQSLVWFYWDIDLIQPMGLTAVGVFSGKVWQLLSFQFLHSCPFPLHVLFNCLGLWFFGRPVEQTLGSRRFLKLYFASGLAGGLLQILLTLLLPRHEDLPCVGASAGVCGMVAIFCRLYPMQELTTWIYFFPVQIRARFLLIFLTGLSVFGALIPFDGIAHGAHLGGILLGIGYLRWRTPFMDWFDRVRGRAEPGLRLRIEPQPAKSLWGRRKAKAIEQTSQDAFISREIDPILDKISANGFGSLTDHEKQVLEAARKKI